MNSTNYLNMAPQKLMNSSKTKANVTTTHLKHDALNWGLAQQILDDCQRAGVPSSYRTSVSEIFTRPDVGPELLKEDGCLVVPLPSVPSALVPATSKSPSVVIIRDESGKGRAYLQLRSGKVLVATQELGISQLEARYPVLYLFGDSFSLDMIRATKALEEEIWVHEMSAQSRHPRVGKPSSVSDEHAFRLPIIARRMITVTPIEGGPEEEGS
ncbi:hypothetical protein [Paraburkholderia caribensis]|uniref:hypothetical protein n=1 Tax=Paraburkholderia caribensis TaxID=75105 RepID=UPI0034D1D373